MKKSLQLFVILVVVAFVAVVACYISARGFSRSHQSTSTSHEWIHQQLGLTADEQKALEPIEEKFERRQRELTMEIREATRELAQAIKEDQTDSARVSSAVRKIHAAQGDLQKVTLQHVFEMKAILTPEQYQKLLKLTADALNEANRDE
jgi:Spy/CpxP family protein refolding chaperone